MDKGYIAPEAAIRKLRAARSLRQTVYIYGATGYGKTELIKQYLNNRRYRYIPAGRRRQPFSRWRKKSRNARQKAR